MPRRKTPRGSCSTQNPDENAVPTRNQTHREKGVDTVLCPERTDSVSREMDILNSREPSRRGTQVKDREPGEPGEPGGAREAGGNNQTACSGVRDRSRGREK